MTEDKKPRIQLDENCPRGKVYLMDPRNLGILDAEMVWVMHPDDAPSFGVFGDKP